MSERETGFVLAINLYRRKFQVFLFDFSIFFTFVSFSLVYELVFSYFLCDCVSIIFWKGREPVYTHIKTYFLGNSIL